MINSAAETIERNKAIKQLIETWKKNGDVRQKALLLLKMNPVQKIKKIKSYLIP